MGSADLMPRNLDTRLEILVPVRDARSQQKVSSAFDSLFADPGAWELKADGRWQRGTRKKGDRSVSGQALLMRNARRRRRVLTDSPERIAP